MYKHYNAAEVFEAIAKKGGPDCRNEIAAMAGNSVRFCFFDWAYINEFAMPEQALWWEKLAEVIDAKPGDTFYLDF